MASLFYIKNRDAIKAVTYYFVLNFLALISCGTLLVHDISSRESTSRNHSTSYLSCLINSLLPENLSNDTFDKTALRLQAKQTA